MNALKLAALTLIALSPAARGADMPENLTPVPFTAVKFTDQFWAPRIEINRTKVVPHNFKMCETTGRIDNFAKAGKLMPGEFRGIFYDDSDLYKAIEGACYTLATHPDPALEKYLDGVIEKIAAAQQPDGYLFTFYTLKGLDKRWTNFKDMHELYCAGHLIEAAVAHHQATGKKTLLNVATKLADHIDSIIGPEPGKKKEICGHEEIELALVRLFHLTKEKRYLNLAKFMIDLRGTDAGGQRKTWGEYHQDHKPLAEQDKPVGHAVRAMYFYTGAADVAAATGDPSYLAPLDRLWRNLTERKMYITGGIGSRHSGEAFGDDWELPNETAYCETCAAIGNALWNSRMNLLHADAKYFDVVERVLYNGFLSGVGLGGDRFFYVNPLASRGSHHRKEWYGTACCPSNVVRVLPSLPGYMYATDGRDIHVNLYAGSTAEVLLAGGKKVKLDQATEYPWNGQIRFTLTSLNPTELTLRLRIPSWCPDPGIISPNQSVSVRRERGYLLVPFQVRAEPLTFTLNLPMPVRRIYSDPNVKSNAGRVALERGPIVYCLEAADNDHQQVYHLSIPKDSGLKAEHNADLLGGVTVIKGKALARVSPTETKPVDFTAIPYYAWDNRSPGQIAVWIPEDPSLATPIPIPTIASAANPSASHCNPTDSVEALNDLVEPTESHEQSTRFTWWPHKGTEEWVQYDFPANTKVSEVEVFWFDDEKINGGCRTPQSWQLLHKSGQLWKPVNATSEYGTRLNTYNKLTFTPVETSGLRLVARLKPGFSGGILEWRVK